MATKKAVTSKKTVAVKGRGQVQARSAAAPARAKQGISGIREFVPSQRPLADINWSAIGAANSIAKRYGMDNQNLAQRRQFIR